MKVSREICIFFIFLNYFAGSYGMRSFVMDFETLKYEFNSKILKLNLKLIDFNKHKAINGSAIYLEDVDQFYIMMWGKAARSDGRRPMTLFNITLNGCEFMANKWGKANMLASVTISELRKQFLGLPTKCPLKKNSEIVANHIMLNEEMFPPYLPDVSFECFYSLAQGNTNLLKIWQTGYVAAKNGELYRKKKLKST